MNPWVLLTIAVLAEVSGSVSMRLSDGFTLWLPTVLVCVLYFIAFWMGALVMRTLGLSITYSVWAGAGMVLSTIVGIFYFKEVINLQKLGGIVIIVIGVMMIALASD